jgi:hypothetical protein
MTSSSITLQVQGYKEKFSSLSRSDAKEEAGRIWKLFIDPSELTCINIPGGIEKAITKEKGKVFLCFA